MRSSRQPATVPYPENEDTCYHISTQISNMENSSITHVWPNNNLPTCFFMAMHRPVTSRLGPSSSTLCF